MLHQPEYLVNTIFSIVSITAPITGCLFGGFVTQFTGGYDSKNALYISFMLGIMGTIPALFVPVCNNIYVISILIWVLLCFGAGMIPPVTGMH